MGLWVKPKPHFLSMPNFQYIPYTLIAVGLINAVYRNEDSSAVNLSYLLILVGSGLFLASRNPKTNEILKKKSTSYFVVFLSAILVITTLLV
jgi:hypothetical protein